MADALEPGSPEAAAALLAFRDEAASQKATAALYKALRTAKLLVPIIGGVRESAPEELDVRLVATGDERGDARLLAFTSERTFRLGGQVPPFAAAPAAGLSGFALRHDVQRLSIDSGGPVSATLDRWELEALADGRIPGPGGQPHCPLTMSALSSELPGTVEAVLRSAFASAPVFLLEERTDGRRHLVLGSVAASAVPMEDLRGHLAPFVGDDRVSVLRLSPTEAAELERVGVRCLGYPT